MSTKSSKFLIGLFVIVGLLLLAATIIWVGASRILMKGSLYAVYFDESVQGLKEDSAVKYRGVAIGRVKNIQVAKDGRLIRILLNLDEPLIDHDQMIAQIKSIGITGKYTAVLPITRSYVEPQLPVFSSASHGTTCT